MALWWFCWWGVGGEVESCQVAFIGLCGVRGGFDGDRDRDRERCGVHVVNFFSSLCHGLGISRIIGTIFSTHVFQVSKPRVISFSCA